MLRRRPYALAALAVAAAGCASAPAADNLGEPAEVVRVIDGDTFDVHTTAEDTAADHDHLRRVRVVGIDTPELDECGGQAAARWARDRLAGETVALGSPKADDDPYGRALRHVTHDGRLFALDAVSAGVAEVATYPPNDRHAEALRVAQDRARRQQRGVWGECAAARDIGSRAAADVQA